jgi:putative zinc finger/helix-turn-helix YgiT family protein
METGEYRFRDEYRRTPVDVGAQGVRCPNCGFQTVTTDQMAEYARAVADAYRRQKGRLTSSEIRAGRAALAMSQDVFAGSVGVGPASIKRWEWGHAQSEDEDRKLRQCINPSAIELDTADAFWIAIQARHELTELPSMEALLPEAWAIDAVAFSQSGWDSLRQAIGENAADRRRGARAVETQLALVA